MLDFIVTGAIVFCAIALGLYALVTCMTELLGQ